MRSIFSLPLPKKVVAKDGTVTFEDNFCPKSNGHGDYYYDIETVSVPKKVNDDPKDDSYVLVLKEKITKRSVDETINSQSEMVGLDNILKRYSLTGDPSVLPKSVVVDDQAGVLDLSEVPQDPADYYLRNNLNSLEAIYATLPDELKQGRSLEDFLKNVSADQIKAYVSSVNPPVQEKEGDK